MSNFENQSSDNDLDKAVIDGSADLLEWLYALRDRQRTQQSHAALVIKGKNRPWEQNRQGRMKWFMHPALHDSVMRSLIVFEQELPPNGRSGVQITPGGAVLYIIEGQGYTLLDDERFDWQAEDVVNIPIRPHGVRVQHVNKDPALPARFVSADLNLVDMLGVDRGARFEQVESVNETPSAVMPQPE